MNQLKKKLAARLLAPTIVIVFSMMLIFGWIAAHMLETEIRQRAEGSVKEQTSRILMTLSAIDSLSSSSVQSAMKVLVREGQRQGTPHLEGSATLGDQQLPELQFGKNSQVAHYELVDTVKELMGGTATLFVRRGSDFVRVSTNVQKADGSRAIGTLLDPQGKAWAALSQGNSFYGVVDILGKAFMTGYEPIRDEHGQTIGAWYVGYPLSALGGLKTDINESKILDHGYLALVRGNGDIIFKPENVTADDIHARMQAQASDDWKTHQVTFEKWNYTLVAAYPASDVASRVHSMQALIALCTILMSGLVVTVMYFVIRKLVSHPVASLVRQMENADLNTVLREDRSDEIGALAATFDQFVSRIRETLIEVARASELLSGATGELAEASHEQATAAGKQSTETNQVVIAMKEMSTTVEQISENSSLAANAAQKASETARNGGMVVDQSVGGMKRLAEAVDKTAERISSLGRRSDEIGKIVSVIEEIAGQTNLLALNAAIEAARAGEQGRGFAVVAGEVRRLAERTASATAEISQMIQTIQQETHRAVEAMGQNTSEVEKASDTTVQAGEQLRQIIHMADEVGNMITQIAAAATEQSVTARQVNQNVDRIAELVNDSAAGAQHSARSCSNLTELSERLQRLVDQFHLKETQKTFAPPRPVAKTLAFQKMVG